MLQEIKNYLKSLGMMRTIFNQPYQPRANKTNELAGRSWTLKQKDWPALCFLIMCGTPTTTLQNTLKKTTNTKFYGYSL